MRLVSHANFFPISCRVSPELGFLFPPLSGRHIDMFFEHLSWDNPFFHGLSLRVVALSDPSHRPLVKSGTIKRPGPPHVLRTLRPITPPRILPSFPPAPLFLSHLTERTTVGLMIYFMRRSRIGTTNRAFRPRDCRLGDGPWEIFLLPLAWHRHQAPGKPAPDAQAYATPPTPRDSPPYTTPPDTFTRSSIIPRLDFTILL